MRSPYSPSTNPSPLPLVQVVTRNLNKIIDVNYYPVPEAERSNKRHRPIGIGVQGLADVFILMRCPFDSEEAQEINIKIFETIYYAALTASCELAQQDGPYSSYEGSPVSKGVSKHVCVCVCLEAYWCVYTCVWVC